MKKGKIDRLMAYIVTFCMLVSMLSGVTLTVSAADPVTVTSIHHNDNQGDGITLMKKAELKENGKVDISIGAYTTGEVVVRETVIPTDIVLVLDVSGSMDTIVETTTVTNYNEVKGDERDAGLLFWIPEWYGFSSTSTTYYIDVNGTKVPLTYAGRDDNEYDYYRYGTSYYYPIMEDGYTNQEFDYPIVQFYSQETDRVSTTRMDVLKKGAKAFIETTLANNAGIENEADMHRVAIVKYADDSYYNGRSQTQTPSLAEGNNRQNNGYNYTQVVKGFLPVNSTNAETLKAAIDSLVEGGATAIDYGITLATQLFAAEAATFADAERAEVMIAFTDGEPNHDSGFDDVVADSALQKTSALKSTKNVTIYSISMAEGADASQIGNKANKFMHYISNNYPEAESMGDATDTGDITKGYYMTPDDDHALETIFTGIMQSIGTPHVKMGAEAVLEDSISSYFELTDGVNSIEIKTVKKTADGWADTGEEDPNIDYELLPDGKTIKVTGFDFDENYVSEQNRGTEENPNYGKMLLIQMNVEPVEEIIDAGASIHHGNVPTNADAAFLTDSDGIIRATVISPTLTLPKVTYSYTINGQNETEYASYYRLPGVPQNVLGEIFRTGYEFDGWSTTDVDVEENAYTMPNANINFVGNFTAKEYIVRYAYSGIVPSGAPNLPGEEVYAYNSEVDVAATPDHDGYNFVGWTALGENITIEENKFTMPARDVTFVGHFEPNESTPYRVEHYLQNLDGETYKLDATEDKVGKTGQIATAIPKTSYIGFTYDDGNENERVSGEIEGDGSLVLKLYYNRNKYNVSYLIDGVKPDGVEEPEGLTDVMYGETVYVEENLDKQGYDFSGWENDTIMTDPNYVEITAGGSFIMPASNVVISGFFTAEDDVIYEVWHYLQNLDGTYGDGEGGGTPAKTEEFKGVTDTSVEAHPVEFTGFTYDDGNENERVSGEIEGDGSLVLKLYYNRNKYKLTYVYNGVVPDEAPQLPNDGEPYEIVYGESVTIEDKVIPPQRYDFHGWNLFETDTEVSGTYEMPARDVTLVGHFHAHNNVPYRIEHYLQDIEGHYPDIPNSHEARTGTTNTDVKVYAHKYDGFEIDEDVVLYNNQGSVFDEEGNNYTLANQVDGDGNLTFKFYYKRLSYDVTYEFEGLTPATLNRETYEVTTEDIFFGTNVDVVVIPENEYVGYTFSGWKNADGEVVEDSFDMPANDVILTGSFIADLNTYTVRHLLENLPGDTNGENFGGKYYTVDDTEEHNNRRTGALVEAVPKNYTGFHPRTDNVLTGRIAGDGSLVINVYYDRHLYDVSYIYYDDGSLPENRPAIPNEYAQEDVPYGMKLEVEDDMLLDGYAFDGWYTITATVTEEAGKQVYEMPARNVVFFGGFVQQFNVSYDLNGGTGAEGVDYSAQTVDAGTEITVKEAPTRSGYNFTGWKEGTVHLKLVRESCVSFHNCSKVVKS